MSSVLEKSVSVIGNRLLLAVNVVIGYMCLYSLQVIGIRRCYSQL